MFSKLKLLPRLCRVGLKSSSQLALADNCLHIRQTQRAPEIANRANMEGTRGGTV